MPVRAPIIPAIMLVSEKHLLFQKYAGILGARLHTGRVRVQLINEEGEFCNDLAQNSKCLPTHIMWGVMYSGRRFSLYVGVPNLVEPCLLMIKEISFTGTQPLGLDKSNPLYIVGLDKSNPHLWSVMI